jgi:hypothetical protein
MPRGFYYDRVFGIEKMAGWVELKGGEGRRGGREWDIQLNDTDGSFLMVRERGERAREQKN